MHARIIVERNKPEYPRIINLLNGKKVFITRVYTETPKDEESVGWSDWTADSSPYYKFKYTPQHGQRIVFIVPKTAEVNIDEFARTVERTRWFSALKKWATIGYSEVDVENIWEFADKTAETLYRLLTKREIFCCWNIIKEWVKDIPERMRRLENLQSVDRTGVYFDYVKEFGNLGNCVLPFEIKIDVFVDWQEFSYMMPYISLRDYIRLTLEIRKNAKFIDLRKIPEERKNVVKYLGKLIEKLEKLGDLGEDYGEKIVLWLKYHKHFAIPD